jgi:hypothetical protein
LAATPCTARADDARGRQSHADCAGRLAGMERGLLQMQRDCAELQSHYDNDLVYLALAASFVRKWMRNEGVASWLHLHHPTFAIALDALVTAADFAVEPGRPMKLPYFSTASPEVSRKSTLSRAATSLVATTAKPRKSDEAKHRTGNRPSSARQANR